MTSDLAIVLTDPERMIHSTMTDTDAESPSYETALPGATSMTSKDVASSFIASMLAELTVCKATEDISTAAGDAVPNDT